MDCGKEVAKMLITKEWLYNWLTKKREEVVNSKNETSTQIVIEKFKCNDGTEISIQASRTHHASVSTDVDILIKGDHNKEAIVDATYYDSFEVYMSPYGSQKTKKMAEYMKDNDSANFVPIQYIVDEINAHNNPSEMDSSLLIGYSDNQKTEVKQVRRATSRTRNRIRRYANKIIMFSHMMDNMINQYAMAVTLGQLSKLQEWKYLEKSVEHFKHEIQDRKTRYGNSLELHGIKKQKAEIQQKIHANKKRFKEIHEKLVLINNDLKHMTELYKNGNKSQTAPYSDVWLKIVELKNVKLDLKMILKVLHKEQSKLKNKLKTIPHCN